MSETFRARVSVWSTGVCSKGTCRGGMGAVSAERLPHPSSTCRTQLLCRYFKRTERRRTGGRPKQGAGQSCSSSKMKNLHSWRVIVFCMLWLTQSLFFLHRDELLNARARACECQGMPKECGAKEEKGAPTCKATYTENEGQFLAYRVIKIQAL